MVFLKTDVFKKYLRKYSIKYKENKMEGAYNAINDIEILHNKAYKQQQV